jgi:hypothetical protein
MPLGRVRDQHRELAAADDRRSLSSLVEKLLADYLKKKGYLKPICADVVAGTEVCRHLVCQDAAAQSASAAITVRGPKVVECTALEIRSRLSQAVTAYSAQFVLLD